MDPELLRHSFALITKREPQLADRFYAKLFERYPATRRLFDRRSKHAKGKMLLDALVLLLANIDDDAWVQQNLAELGHRHQSYGVTPEMYRWFGETLVETFLEISGDDWTHDVEAEWRNAYEVIGVNMRKGYPASDAGGPAQHAP
jgi:hemoglobin-like flavoprotein